MKLQRRNIGTESLSGSLDRAIFYACGGLRVTTRVTSVSTGPRAHIVGMLTAFERLGFAVTKFLPGDRVGSRATDAGSTARLSGSIARSLSDTARVLMNPIFGLQCRRQSREVAIFYERIATLHCLGFYRRRRSAWIVESNGPFWYEAGEERGTLKFVALAKRIEMICYRKSDLVVVVSETLRDIISVEGNVDRSKIVVVPNAVDPSRFAAPRGRRADGKLRVIFVGHVIQWAGLVLLLETMATLLIEGVEFELQIAGDGPQLLELKDLAEVLGVAHHINFLGLVSWDRIPGILSAADVAFSGQISMSIGGMYHSPLKLYEYAAAGLPIIATDHDDSRELILSSGAGWLYAENDSKGLADALREAHADRENLRSRGLSLQAYVIAHHTWETRAHQLVSELGARGLLPAA